MQDTIENRESNLQRSLEKLACNKFTGETVLRFSGSNFDGIFSVPKDFKEDKRPEQNIATVYELFSLCRRYDTFGLITLIWYKGAVKNYTVKLTFQGESAEFQTKRIFQVNNQLNGKQ